MSRIRLIASDLDGTLLAPDGQLSRRTLEAIAAVHEGGIELVAATGRGFRTSHYRLRPAPQLKTAICSNGALVYDLVSSTVERTRPISGDALRSLFDALRHSIPELRFGWESIDGLGFEDGFGLRPGDGDSDPSLEAGPQTVAELDSAIKAFIAHPLVESVELQRLLADKLPASMNGSTSGARFVEVTARGVDKGTTLAALAEARGVRSDEVLAIGDQMNDESMLRWAGVAVAMGNARPEIKAFADLVAPSSAEDGAAQVLEAVAGGRL